MPFFPKVLFSLLLASCTLTKRNLNPAARKLLTFHWTNNSVISEIPLRQAWLTNRCSFCKTVFLLICANILQKWTISLPCQRLTICEQVMQPENPCCYNNSFRTWLLFQSLEKEIQRKHLKHSFSDKSVFLEKYFCLRKFHLNKLQ